MQKIANYINGALAEPNAKSYLDNINPATGKVEGSYGDKFKGTIKADESVITKENGFDEIVEGKGSPYHTINQMHEKWKKENGYA
jgi:hypothetical protein